MDREHFATINFARTASRDLRYESILVKVTDPNILEQLPVSVVHNCKVILNNIFFCYQLPWENFLWFLQVLYQKKCTKTIFIFIVILICTKDVFFYWNYLEINWMYLKKCKSNKLKSLFCQCKYQMQIPVTCSPKAFSGFACRVGNFVLHFDPIQYSRSIWHWHAKWAKIPPNFLKTTDLYHAYLIWHN